MVALDDVSPNIQVAQMATACGTDPAGYMAEAPALSAFVSWNAKHFVGKLGIPALTPREWLRRDAGRRRRKARAESRA